MTKEQRFVTFDNAVYRALTELMGCVPTDITTEDIDTHLGASLSGLVKDHVRTQQHDTTKSPLGILA